MLRKIIRYSLSLILFGLAFFATVAAPAIGQAFVNYQWRGIAGDPDQVALYRNGVQVGNYHYADGFYYHHAGGDNWRIAKSPIAPPLGGLEGNSSTYKFGVAWPAAARRQRITSGGTEITSAQARELITADLKDDSKASSLTYVSKDPEKVKIAEKWWAQIRAQADPNGRVCFRSYWSEAPVNKAMLASFKLDQDVQFQRTGEKMIGQPPADPKTGKAPERSWYERPFDELAIDFVRTCDPSYDPNKNKMPKIPGLGDVTNEHLALAGVCGVIGIAAYRRRKQTL